MLPRPLRLGVAFATVALLLALFARPARGEEAIVLDNGAVLRGTVIKEDATSLVFKLSGVGTDSRITIERDHVARRFVTKDSRSWATDLQGPPSPSISGPEAVPTIPAPTPTVGTPPPLPDEEPQVHQEGFFSRTARRAELAFPADPGSRAFLAALAVVILLCLVGLGGKMVELENLTLGRSTLLALFLGALVGIDWSSRGSLLRADTAAIVIPIQLAVWVGCSSLVLRCGVRRAVQLLAFVLFAGALVTFSTGAVLVMA